MSGRWLVGGGVVAAVAAIAVVVVMISVGAPAKEAPDYQVSDCEPGALKVEGETWGGSVVSVSPSGKYILGDGEAMLWRPDGEPVSIPDAVDEPLKLRASEGVAVNSGGMVIGTGYTKGDNEYVSWMYTDGEAARLEPPSGMEGKETSVESVNDRGDIVGTVNLGGGEHAAVKWESGATEAEELPSAKHTQIEQLRIADDGSVIGAANLDGEVSSLKAWKWASDAEPEELPFPKQVLSVEVAGNWVLAEVEGDDGGSRHYRWDGSGDPERLDVDGGAIDSRGRVFGSDGKSPAVETDSGMEKLPLPGDAKSDDFNVSAAGIHSGVIGGSGESQDGQTAFSWRCK